MSPTPIKIRILQLINHNEGISNEDLLANLKKEYTLDRNVNEKGLENYLISLKTVGMITLTDIIFDKSGKLKQFYKITEYGAARMKFADTEKSLQEMKYPV